MIFDLFKKASIEKWHSVIMDHTKGHRRLARGNARWQAPRLKPVVQKKATQKVKK